MSASAAFEETYRGYLARIGYRRSERGPRPPRRGSRGRRPGGAALRGAAPGRAGGRLRPGRPPTPPVRLRHPVPVRAAVPTFGSDRRRLGVVQGFPGCGAAGRELCQHRGAGDRAAFTGRPGALHQAAAGLGGQAPTDSFPHDLALAIPALPKVPLLLLFTDADDEFPAACSVLFERRAAAYLDMECLAMLGMQLARRLASASGTGAE